MRWLRRGPVYGPPLPPCDEQHWRSWYGRCEKPLGHAGKHGRVIGSSTRTGGLVESTSTTWQLWS